ncbi:MAG: polyprenol monophosphomannose synthase [Actinobacteria bacterium]|nr:polyprenol monophosphomannose synthase [Actinomycetota bacterium]
MAAEDDVVRTLVVVPTYVEAPNIELFLDTVRKVVPEADILVVDDSSPDGTADLAQRKADELGRIEVMRRPVKDGLGNAYRAGFGHGLDQGYTRLVQLDVDFSHDPAMIPALLARLDDGAGVAIGSRYVVGGSTPNWPLHRQLLSKWGNAYATWLLGLKIHDATAGFRAYRADVLETIDFRGTIANGYAFQMEIAYRLAGWGGRIDEVPIAFTDRVRGESKMSSRIMAESMLLVTRWGVRDRFRSLTKRSTASD